MSKKGNDSFTVDSDDASLTASEAAGSTPAQQISHTLAPPGGSDGLAQPSAPTPANTYAAEMDGAIVYATEPASAVSSPTSAQEHIRPVSYTHLTLPTMRTV